MKSSFRFWVSFSILLMAAFPIFAAHIIGGQLSYKCLGSSNNYEFTMTLYRDCNGGGAPFDSGPGAPFSGTVTIYIGNATVPFAVKSLNSPVIESVVPQPGGGGCSVSLICVEKGIYTFTISLPATASDVHVTYQRCCRNNTLSNIIAPGETGMTFTTTINPAAAQLCNASPVFLNPAMACSKVGEPFSFDHSFIDEDGDELVYEFCAPLLGGGADQSNVTSPGGLAPDPDMPPPYADVMFLGPLYSFDQPIPGAPPFTIAPLTGEVSGTPNILGQFLYSICVREYRNGQLLSVSRFEYQHNVLTALTAAEEAVAGAALQISPNPSSGQARIALPASQGVFEISLFRVSGKILKTWQDVEGESFDINEQLPPGTYFIQVKNKQGIWRGKWLVER